MTATTTPDPTPDPTPDRRSDRKRQAILAAATGAFLHGGYLGTSMDEIARSAQVSKQTVYKHFSDKQSLFTAIVTDAVELVADLVADEVRALAEAEDVEADLRAVARHLLERVMKPEILALRRLVIGEAGRFPELGRTFHDQGPGRTTEALAAAFARLADRGRLALEDPALAAAHFNWLVMSIPLNEAMLLGRDEAPAPAELARYADAGVRAFLTGYGPR